MCEQGLDFLKTVLAPILNQVISKDYNLELKPSAVRFRNWINSFTDFLTLKSLDLPDNDQWTRNSHRREEQFG
jgi:hypothetical protein